MQKHLQKTQKKILRDYGCNEKFDKAEQIFKLIIALGQDDIRDAILKKDIKRFFELCDKYSLLPEKNILSLQTNSNRQQSYNYIASGNNQQLEIVTIAGAVAIAAVAVIFIAGVEAIMNVHFIADAAVYVTHRGDTSIISKQKQNYLLERTPDIIDLYILKNGCNDIFLYRNECIENIINQSMSFFKQRYPDYFNTHSEEEFKNILRLNLIEYSNSLI